MFLRLLITLLCCLFCVNAYTEKTALKNSRHDQRNTNSTATYVDGAGLTFTGGPFLEMAKREVHPGPIIFPEDKNFLELSLKERFRVLYERRVSYDEFNDPKYANPKYGSLYNKWNPLNPEPRIEKEIIAKLHLIRLFCGPFRAKTPVATMQENAEMASALIADYLSEEEWGIARVELEELTLRTQNFSEVDIAEQLRRRENFYARRLRSTRDSNNMTTLQSAAGDFISLLLNVYPDNMDKAGELYEKSLIPQKTIFGKMSDVYKSAHMHENSCAADKIRIYNAIREAEARRERERSTAE